MEDRIILSERLEEQLKAIEWAREEQKRILNERKMERAKETALNLSNQRKPGSE